MEPLKGTRLGGAQSEETPISTGVQSGRARWDCFECPRKERRLRPGLEDHGAKSEQDKEGKTSLRGGYLQHVGFPNPGA